MLHITINGTEYQFNNESYPLGEVIALEKVTGLTFQEWNAQLERGSMTAMAGLLWLVLRRNGENIKFSQLESGDYQIDMATLDITDPDAPPEEEEDGGKATGKANPDDPDAATGVSETNT